MSFYTGLYNGGLYSNVGYTSKYRAGALRQKQMMNTPMAQNPVYEKTPSRPFKSGKVDNGKYALATISLMAISCCFGYKMKGGFKNIGAGIKKLACGAENLIKKGFTAAQSGIKNLGGKLKGLFTKP